VLPLATKLLIQQATLATCTILDDADGRFDDDCPSTGGHQGDENAILLHQKYMPWPMRRA